MSRSKADVELLRRHVQRFQVLQRISQQLVSELDIDRLLSNILSAAIEVTEAQAGTLYLLDEASDELEFRVVVGGGGEKLVGRRMGREQSARLKSHLEGLRPGVDLRRRNERHSLSAST